MQFTRIHLENWRNFSLVDVKLQTRAFLVGANASGKSNFLDAFRFLRDLVVTGGGFREAVTRRGGVSSLRNLAARYPNTNVTIEADLGESWESLPLWSYRIVFNQDNRSRPILREEKIWHHGILILDRPNDEDKNDEARLTQTYLEQTFANREFREVTEFFESISYFHVVPQLVRDPERSIGRQSDPYGGDFLEQIAAVNKQSQEARLRRIEAALKIAVPQLSSLELNRDEKGVPHVRGKYQHWRLQGAWQTEAEFSDGTLRLMGLLWALQVGSGPLLLEEPELSLHPSVVRHLPQMMQRIQRQMKASPRQIMVSTHSAELLADEGIAPGEVLLLLTTREGTEVKVGSSLEEIMQELGAGFSLAEAVLARTEPEEVRQLAFLKS